MPTSLYLIRHAAYDHRPSLAGDAASDFGLNAVGVQQAALLAARLRNSGEIKPEAFFSSTLARAVQTADHLAPVFGISAVPLPELCEWESGNDALGEVAFSSAWERLSPRWLSGLGSGPDPKPDSLLARSEPTASFPKPKP